MYNFDYFIETLYFVFNSRLLYYLNPKFYWHFIIKQQLTSTKNEVPDTVLICLLLRYASKTEFWLLPPNHKYSVGEE